MDSMKTSGVQRIAAWGILGVFVLALLCFLALVVYTVPLVGLVGVGIGALCWALNVIAEGGSR